MVEISGRPLDGAARIVFAPLARPKVVDARSLVGGVEACWKLLRRQTTFRRPPAAPEAPIYSENLNLTRS
jgi:hypothetical protein